MQVERDRAHLLQPGDDRMPDGEVRHEVVVHDIHVNQIGAGDAAELGLEVREVGGEDARVDPLRHDASLPIAGGASLTRCARAGR